MMYEVCSNEIHSGIALGKRVVGVKDIQDKQ
jgi:hypothetical protein